QIRQLFEDFPDVAVLHGRWIITGLIFPIDSARPAALRSVSRCWRPAADRAIVGSAPYKTAKPGSLGNLHPTLTAVPNAFGSCESRTAIFSLQSRLLHRLNALRNELHRAT